MSAVRMVYGIRWLRGSGRRSICEVAKRQESSQREDQYKIRKASEPFGHREPPRIGSSELNRSKVTGNLYCIYLNIFRPSQDPHFLKENPDRLRLYRELSYAPTIQI